MLSEFLKKNIESQADYIKANGYGYGQVEPNHLSAQATKERLTLISLRMVSS